MIREIRLGGIGCLETIETCMRPRSFIRTDMRSTQTAWSLSTIRKAAFTRPGKGRREDTSEESGMTGETFSLSWRISRRG